MPAASHLHDFFFCLNPSQTASGIDKKRKCSDASVRKRKDNELVREHDQRGSVRRYELMAMSKRNIGVFVCVRVNIYTL